MRISGGEWGGRPLKPPPRGTRPTSEKVREAVFSSLAKRIPDSSFLDLFAGSGAMGLEAASRGAKKVVMVENNRKASALIRENMGNLGAPATVECASTDGMAYVQRGGARFDLIFADPPYEWGSNSWREKLMQAIAWNRMLNRDGLFVAEMQSNVQEREVPGWERVRVKAYGGTRLEYWKQA